MVDVICRECGELKRRYAKGLCKRCYNKIYQQKIKHLDSLTTDHVSMKTMCSYNFDTDCIKIHTYFMKSSGYNGGFEINKSCSHWLGDRSETILMNMFDHVERMPFNNPGYDFTCGKGYKIDAKSSCIRKGNYMRWDFHISQNTIPDFFLCLAFDNREDLNPLHVWLIPGKDINHQISASISKSTLDRWSKYEQLLDKVLLCCDRMKFK